MGPRARRLGASNEQAFYHLGNCCRVPHGILRDCILTGNGTQPLRLVQTIPLPNVKGRLDHVDVDVKGKRLFVAELENSTFSELGDSFAMQP
jgi:hypothetical protein